MFHVKHSGFDVIVIGCGHAGSEAAFAAARLGVSVAVVTHRFDRIGEMSCNPAIGGLGKGHLVREIDALDGVMGRLADRAGIQFRLLNRRKGPAVQGPRTQIDRALYRDAMQEEIRNAPRIRVIEAEVDDLLIDGRRVTGVRLADGSQVHARSTILTAGTFLRGVIHIGDRRVEGGRWGDRPANGLGQTIDSFGLPMGRLKTGTPPRLDGRTIDWDVLDMQEADPEPSLFSFLSTMASARQISCGITHTNPQTHDIIRENLDRSAMYGGHIDGIGPRYCPSIEDKVMRFADKSEHQVFLEPESLTDDVVYPNGISTSLPEDIQREYVQSMRGLERAAILQPGYAIEYDYVDPRALDHRLAVQDFAGLWLAGQINGTTGYEEAAAQGLIAGLNAAATVSGGDPVIFDRAEAYIGVLIDDLVTRGVTEPYRMFTSRAEFRLSLRADNADQRLTARGIRIGCVSAARARAFNSKMECMQASLSVMAGMSETPNTLSGAGIEVRQDGQRRSVFDMLRQRTVEISSLKSIWPALETIPEDILRQIQIDAIYAYYIERQARDIEQLRSEEAAEVPYDLDYSAMSGLSNELREKLMRTRPRSIAQAGRIDGMTPAALSLVFAEVQRRLAKSA
ncbi:MAG: tRNA uridine-5-carboxymethylaminomethyl(34) synthesis enzyme MnmG [Pseudomonadota bacterium]